MLRTTALGVRRGSAEVLQGVDLAVSAGSWLAVVGPNGAGKSTLLSAVAGLLPHTGDVELGGQNLRSLRPRERAQVLAYAPQEPELPADLTVTEYVLLGRTPHRSMIGGDRPADTALVAEVLEQLDLTRHAAHRLDRLSGGERRRAVLGRALAQRAPLLLLDEPTSGLDVGHAQQLLELLDGLRRSEAVTLVTTLHDLTLAGQYADALLLLDGGHTVAAGPPGDVLRAAVLGERYQATLTVLDPGDGSLAVVPLRPRQ
jgi:iron complex transport system ATP-binding protein